MKSPPPRVRPPLVEGTKDDINYIRLATWNHTMDEVDGVCDPSRVDHKCVHGSPCVVRVAFIINLEEAFKSFYIATMVRLLVVNVLVNGFPKLIYALLPTYNSFDTNVVSRQWHLIHKLHQAHLKPTVGSLISHGSDSNARRRSCMLTIIAQVHMNCHLQVLL